MLVIIAYDICDAKRLRQVAECCKDFGLRVQYSVFECHLEADRIDQLWERLCGLIDPAEDRLVAYPIHGKAKRDIRCHGTMVTYRPAVSYQY